MIIPDRALPTRLRRLAGLARARLVWETYAPGLAVPVLGGLAFATLSVLGAWEVLGDPVRLLAVAAVIALFVRGGLAARRRRFPSRSDALRRLERTAGLSHRPLDALQDAPVLSPDLWPTHQREAARAAGAVRRVGRVPALSPIDPAWLRILAPLALLSALVVAFGFSAERLRRALSPAILPVTQPGSLSFEAWVDPPDYTGRPPIYAQTGEAIVAPEGSTLVVRASGAPVLPRPRYRDTSGARFLDTEALGEASVEVRTRVETSATLDWRIGWRRELFSIQALPDDPPTIEVTDPVEADKRDRLVVTFDADDDYGVDRLLIEMVELTDALDPDAPFASGVLSTNTETAPFQSAEGRTLKLDLTRHPLAGRKVVGRLVAVDGAGQRGESAPLYFTVPDKIFVEPLAKAIVEQRALLVAGTAGDQTYTTPPKTAPDMDVSDGTFDTFQSAWRLDRAPAPVRRASALIDAVTDQPAPNVFNDPVVYMGLRHVGKTLRYARSETVLHGLPEHMWKLAIRAEYGVLGTALQEMQEAEAALREGIARRAPQREIDTLFERYNQAVDAYMEELRRNAERTDGEDGGGGGGPPMGSTDQIQELLDAIEEANARGDTEGARQALAQLAELLENMQIQLAQGQGGGGDGEGGGGEMSEEMRQSLEDLAELLGDQRDLQDETRQAEREELARELRGEEDGAGDGGSVSPEALARRQSEIERALEGLGDQLDEQGLGGREGDRDEETAGGDGQGETGAGGEGDGAGQPGTGSAQDGLGRAEEAMRLSEEALARGDLGGSRQAQAEAIRALREAGDALARSIETANRDGEGEADPLGRRSPDGFGGDNAQSDIEQKDDATRSREILEELRRRASEAERDQQEQDYLERLLERF